MRRTLTGWLCGASSQIAENGGKQSESLTLFRFWFTRVFRADGAASVGAGAVGPHGVTEGRTRGRCAHSPAGRDAHFQPHQPAMASTRAVLQVFEKYQKDRVTFVQTVAELATRPQNIEPMQSAGVMALLRPLLLDNVPR